MGLTVLLVIRPDEVPSLGYVVVTPLGGLVDGRADRTARVEKVRHVRHTLGCAARPFLRGKHGGWLYTRRL